MYTAEYRIWTLVAVFISYDNYYNRETEYMLTTEPKK